MVREGARRRSFHVGSQRRNEIAREKRARGTIHRRGREREGTRVPGGQTTALIEENSQPTSTPWLRGRVKIEVTN